MDNESTGTSLREWLASHGATDAQLKSKVVSLIEDAVADSEVGADATVRGMVDGLQDRVRDLEDKIAAGGTQLGGYERRLRAGKVDVSNVELRLQRLRETIDTMDTNLTQNVLEDKSKKEAIVAFAKVLSAVRDTFGADAMSEAVICKAIEAASYGMWRSLAEPPNKEQDRSRAYRVM